MISLFDILSEYIWLLLLLLATTAIMNNDQITFALPISHSIYRDYFVRVSFFFSISTFILKFLFHSVSVSAHFTHLLLPVAIIRNVRFVFSSDFNMRPLPKINRRPLILLHTLCYSLWIDRTRSQSMKLKWIWNIGTRNKKEKIIMAKCRWTERVEARELLILYTSPCGLSLKWFSARQPPNLNLSK